MKYLLLPLALLLTLNAHAQITFEKSYGGSQEEEGRAVQQTMDGGYILAVSSRSFGGGNYDLWLIKTDEYGDTTWSKTFGGTGYDTAGDVLETTNGGYILVGYTSSFGDENIFILRTDSNGDTLWTRTMGGSHNEHIYDIKKTSDGGYILCGDIDLGGIYEYSLIKIDSQGNVQWQHSYNYGQAYEIQQTTDGGYVLVIYPYTDPSGIIDMKLVKTDLLGNISWTKTYGGHSYDMSFAVQQTTDGGYILGGRTDSFGAGSSDFWLLKTNANGDSLWSQTFGGPSDERAFSLQQTQDGGFIMDFLKGMR